MLNIVDHSATKPVALRRKSTRLRSAPKRLVKDAINPNVCPVCGKSLHFNPKQPDANICKKDHLDVDIGESYKVSSKHTHYAQMGNERIRQTMLKVINVEDRRMPKSNAGKYAMLEEVQQIKEAIAKLAEGKAIECSIEKHNFDALKKDNAKANPAKSVVNFFRRYFEQNGLSFKAYANDDRTITVIHYKKSDKKKK